MRRGKTRGKTRGKPVVKNCGAFVVFFVVNSYLVWIAGTESGQGDHPYRTYQNPWRIRSKIWWQIWWQTGGRFSQGSGGGTVAIFFIGDKLRQIQSDHEAIATIPVSVGKPYLR